jgi:hypothetical protein
MNAERASSGTIDQLNWGRASPCRRRRGGLVQFVQAASEGL